MWAVVSGVYGRSWMSSPNCDICAQCFCSSPVKDDVTSFTDLLTHIKLLKAKYNFSVKYLNLSRIDKCSVDILTSRPQHVSGRTTHPQHVHLWEQRSHRHVKVKSKSSLNLTLGHFLVLTADRAASFCQHIKIFKSIWKCSWKFGMLSRYY